MFRYKRDNRPAFIGGAGGIRQDPLVEPPIVRVVKPKRFY